MRTATKHFVQIVDVLVGIQTGYILNTNFATLANFLALVCTSTFQSTHFNKYVQSIFVNNV